MRSVLHDAENPEADSDTVRRCRASRFAHADRKILRTQQGRKVLSFCAVVLMAALAVAPSTLGGVTESASASSDGWRTGQPSEDLWEEFPLDPGDRDGGASVGRQPGRDRAGESKSQPEDESLGQDSEVADTRFTADRIVMAVALQALLLAVIAGFILHRRSARRGRGDRPKSQSDARRSSSRRSADLEPVDEKHVTQHAPVSINAVPERDTSTYVCLSLTDGRTIEGSLRGKEANGLVMLIDVDHVIEPDGTRRRGNVEDTFVPVSTVERERTIAGPRSA